MKKLLLLLCCCLLPMLAQAQSTPSAAPTESDLKIKYDREQYPQVIEGYKQMLLSLDVSPSAALYYNLGNAYYRNGELGWAVLAYERALRLSPRDKYIQHNLQIATSQTTDRLEYPTSYLQGVWHSICYALPPVLWMLLSLLLFALLAAAFLTFIFVRKRVIRQTAFFTGLASLALFLFCSMVVWTLNRNYRDGRQAIIIEGQVAAKSAPSGAATSLFVLHEGSKIMLEDLPEEDGQVAITLPDGTLAWLPSSALIPVYPFTLKP